MNLKKQLEFYLESNDVNLSQLARLTGVPRQNFSNWMIGQAPKDITQVKKVADYFNVSLDHLLFGDGKSIAPGNFDQTLKGQFEIRIRKIAD